MSSPATRVVAISDTHCMHGLLTLPEGDVLVHTGDFCGRGSVAQAEDFAAWFAQLPHPHKVVIAGNHDRCLEDDPTLAERLFAAEDVTYLFDTAATVAGLRFHGSPWQPAFFDWAFNLPRGQPLAEKWALIDEDVDVLLTHGPPSGVLDGTTRGVNVGCEALTEALARVRPRLHIFGHIHEGYGALHQGETLYVNACTCTVDYRPANPPIVIDMGPEGCAVVPTG